MRLNCCKPMRIQQTGNTCSPLGNPGRPEKLGTRLKPADMRPSTVPPYSSPKRDRAVRWTPGRSRPATTPGSILTISQPLSTGRPSGCAKEKCLCPEATNCAGLAPRPIWLAQIPSLRAPFLRGEGPLCNKLSSHVLISFIVSAVLEGPIAKNNHGDMAGRREES